MSTSPMDLLEPENSFEADETVGFTSMDTITNNNVNTPAAERTLGLERGNTMEDYNIGPAPWPAGMGGMDASDLQVSHSSDKLFRSGV